MKGVTHHGRTTTFRQTGNSGPTLLYVHGSGASHAVWKGQLARLSGEYRGVAVDLSGHGDAHDVATPAGPETMSAYGEDVAAVAEATAADVLVGNSLGGAVVLSLLLDGDIEPMATVLVGTGARLAVAPDLLGWLSNDFERAVEFLHGPDMLFHDPDERYLTVSKAAMYDVGRAVTERDFRTSDMFDIRGRLDEIPVPTFAITGEYDQLTPPKFHEYLAENLPDGRWETVPDAAHFSMLERPDAFNQRLRSFLESVIA